MGQSKSCARVAEDSTKMLFPLLLLPPLFSSVSPGALPGALPGAHPPVALPQERIVGGVDASPGFSFFR